MPTKTITIKKRGGGTRKQKVKVLASGKYKFMKNPTTKRRKSPTRKKKKKYKRRSTTARRKKRTSRRGFSYQSLFPLLKAAAFIAPGAVEFTKGYDIDEAAAQALMKYTSINFKTGEQNWSMLIEGWGPLLAVSVATAVIPRISGLFRRLL